MSTIKAYTNLQQSKKLAEILPIESADMHYNDWNDDFCVGYKHTGEYIVGLGAPITIRGELEIPCWSLAALLGVLPNGIVINKDSQNGKYHFSSKYIRTYVTADNPIDACVAVILKLKELSLL